MTLPTVYVVDDQPAVRLALGEMLSVLGYRVETFGSAEEFLARLDDGRPGCIVADVRMPGMDGIELMRELASRSSRLPVILISGHADVPMAVAAMKAGAEDFVEKPLDDAQLVAAINRCLAQAFGQQSSRQSRETLEQRFAQLTPREAEVFDHVVLGHTSQAIADLLEISVRTVEGYRVQIMIKMQAESVPALVRQAIKLGRIEP
jgi:two-component system response regulator FixJ